MRKIGIAITALGLLLGVYFGKQYSSALSSGDEEEGRELNAPHDWFSLQRSYPDTIFPVEAFQRAMQIAARGNGLSKNSPPGYDRNWTVEGPYNIGGRYNTIAVDPINHDIIYAGAAEGGVFKTTDGGENWKPIFDDFSWLGIGTITIDPKDHNTVYVGTGDPNITADATIGDGLYRSKDGGKSWEHLGLTSQRIISKIIIHPDSSNIIYAATMGLPFVRDSSRGLYKSIDSGKTWQQVFSLGTDAGIIDLVMQPGNPQVLYAAGWTRIRNYKESITIGPKNKIYKSTDGGKTWTTLTNGLPTRAVSRIGLAISKDHPEKLYANITSNSEGLEGVYVTTNGGDSWSALPLDGLDPGSLEGNYGWYFGKIFIDPKHDDIVYLPSIDLYRYEGGFWTMFSPAWYTYEVHGDDHDLQWLDDNSFLMATDGGIYKYDAFDSPTWGDMDATPVTQFYHVALNPNRPGYYYGGAQDNGTTGGNSKEANWPRIFGGDGFQPAFVSNDPSVIFVETQNGAIFSKSDFGFLNFTDGIYETERRNWDMPYMVSPHDPNVMYAGTYRMYRTSAGPSFADWKPISKDLTNDGATMIYMNTISTITESPLTEGYLFAGTTDGRVWRTLDGGQKWQLITAGLPNRYVTHVRVSPSHDSIIYVTQSGYKSNEFIPHIHKSTNLGDSWTDISGDLPPVAVNDVLICPTDENILLAATDAGVYGTKDGGVHWDRLGNNMPIIPVVEIVHDTFTKRVVAATFARSMMSYSLDSIFPVQLNAHVQPPVSTLSIQAYPNPCLDRMQIRVEGTLDASLEVTLLDVRGRVIHRDTYPASVGRVNINTSALSKGVYLLDVKSGKLHQTQKIMKQ